MYVNKDVDIIKLVGSGQYTGQLNKFENKNKGRNNNHFHKTMAIPILICSYETWVLGQNERDRSVQ